MIPLARLLDLLESELESAADLREQLASAGLDDHARALRAAEADPSWRAQAGWWMSALYRWGLSRWRVDAYWLLTRGVYPSDVAQEVRVQWIAELEDGEHPLILAIQRRCA